MNYEWDINNAQSNFQNYGVDFADVVSVFADSAAIRIVDKNSDKNQFVTIGTTAFGEIIVVVYFWRNNKIKLVSARKVTELECKQYKG
jgi:uncharacterized protein